MLPPALAYPHQNTMFSARMLAVYQPEPGCHLAAIVEVPTAAIIAVVVFGPTPENEAIL